MYAVFVYPVMSREIEEVEGDLRLNGKNYAKQKQLEVSKAKTIDELWAISKERVINQDGYIRWRK